jgi:hypothetical protein
MLFNIDRDPDCVTNLADENPQKRDELRQALMAKLKRQGDPRALGQGRVFDDYPTVRPAPKHWGQKPRT